MKKGNAAAKRRVAIFDGATAAWSHEIKSTVPVVAAGVADPATCLHRSLLNTIEVNGIYFSGEAGSVIMNS